MAAGLLCLSPEWRQGSAPVTLRLRRIVKSLVELGGEAAGKQEAHPGMPRGHSPAFDSRNDTLIVKMEW